MGTKAAEGDRAGLMHSQPDCASAMPSSVTSSAKNAPDMKLDEKIEPIPEDPPNGTGPSGFGSPGMPGAAARATPSPASSATERNIPKEVAPPEPVATPEPRDAGSPGR